MSVLTETFRLCSVQCSAVQWCSASLPPSGLSHWMVSRSVRQFHCHCDHCDHHHQHQHQQKQMIKLEIRCQYLPQITLTETGCDQQDVKSQDWPSDSSRPTGPAAQHLLLLLGFLRTQKKNRNNLGTALLRHLTPSNNSHSILTTQNTHNFVGQQSAVNTAKIFGCSTN